MVDRTKRTGAERAGVNVENLRLLAGYLASEESTSKLLLDAADEIEALRERAKAPSSAPASEDVARGFSKKWAALTFAIYKDEALVRRETVTNDVIQVGKDAKSQLYVDDDLASRLHAVIEVVSPDDILLIDLGGELGTMVNGVRADKSKIKPGDAIQIGGTKIVLECVELVASAAAAASTTREPASPPSPAPASIPGDTSDFFTSDATPIFLVHGSGASSNFGKTSELKVTAENDGAARILDAIREAKEPAPVRLFVRRVVDTKPPEGLFMEALLAGGRAFLARYVAEPTDVQLLVNGKRAATLKLDAAASQAVAVKAACKEMGLAAIDVGDVTYVPGKILSISVETRA
jgi:hypothetical protein